MPSPRDFAASIPPTNSAITTKPPLAAPLLLAVTTGWPAVGRTSAVKPSEARTVWLDTRDRILPNRSLYLTIAGAGTGSERAFIDEFRKSSMQNAEDFIKKGTAEMAKVFNLGLGMIVVVPEADFPKAIDSLRSHGQRAVRVGEIVGNGKGEVRLV